MQLSMKAAVKMGIQGPPFATLKWKWEGRIMSRLSAPDLSGPVAKSHVSVELMQPLYPVLGAYTEAIPQGRLHTYYLHSLVL